MSPDVARAAAATSPCLGRLARNAEDFYVD